MKKLKLTTDKLRVESFSTSSKKQTTGTVQGNTTAHTEIGPSCDYACIPTDGKPMNCPVDTCYITCEHK